METKTAVITSTTSSTSAAISSSVGNSKVGDISAGNPDRLQNIVNKYRGKGLKIVADYLLIKARKSKRTAITFSFGLDYLSSFIEHNYNGYNIQTILPVLRKEERKRKNAIDIYELLNSFVLYLQNDTKNSPNLSPKSVGFYMAVARSYFLYNDIEISSIKFKYKISLPPVYHEDEEAIDANDIKEILNHCANRRLKAYLLILASGGMRAIEALAIRECDLDFSGINFNDPNDRSNPAGVRIRKEYSKTRTERHIFISNEAARYLNDWLNWKYRDRHAENKRLKNRVKNRNDLVISKAKTTTTINTNSDTTTAGSSNNYPHGLYNKVLVEFQKVLVLAGLASRKEDGVYKRRKITFHSFRRFAKTTIANQTRNSDYSEWFLGHKKSPYYTNKPEELRRIYKEDCMKYLTFLDYPTIEATGRSFEAKLKEKDREIEMLRRQIKEISETKKVEQERTTDAIGDLTQVIEGMKKQIKELQDRQK